MSFPDHPLIIHDSKFISRLHSVDESQPDVLLETVTLSLSLTGLQFLDPIHPGTRWDQAQGP